MATFAAYSPFFSSGLLAPHTPRKNGSAFSDDDNDLSTSPSCPSSPMAFPVDTDMDDDTPHAKSNMRRSLTPTQPHVQPFPSAHELAPAAIIAVGNPPPARTLRRRRSSLTQSISPITSIRSPQRAAENALHLQRQLDSHSRSGSVTGDRYSGLGVVAVASESTSLVGRMRSGSLGSALRSGNASGSTLAAARANVPPVPSVRNRRITARRAHTMPIAPPPTAPLPALPHALPSSCSGAFPHSRSQSLALRTGNLGYITNVSNSKTSTKERSPILVTASVNPTSARARGLSVSNSALDGAENRIDEEMKEN